MAATAPAAACFSPPSARDTHKQSDTQHLFLLKPQKPRTKGSPSFGRGVPAAVTGGGMHREEEPCLQSLSCRQHCSSTACRLASRRRPRRASRHRPPRIPRLPPRCAHSSTLAPTSHSHGRSSGILSPSPQSQTRHTRHGWSYSANPLLYGMILLPRSGRLCPMPALIGSHR